MTLAIIVVCIIFFLLFRTIMISTTRAAYNDTRWAKKKLLKKAESEGAASDAFIECANKDKYAIGELISTMEKAREEDDVPLIALLKPYLAEAKYILKWLSETFETNHFEDHVYGNKAVIIMVNDSLFSYRSLKIFLTIEKDGKVTDKVICDAVNWKRGAEIKMTFRTKEPIGPEHTVRLDPELTEFEVDPESKREVLARFRPPGANLAPGPGLGSYDVDTGYDYNYGYEYDEDPVDTGGFSAGEYTGFMAAADIDDFDDAVEAHVFYDSMHDGDDHW